MDTAIIRRYLDLKQQLVAIQREIQQLQPAIVHQIKQAGGRVHFEDYALISQVSRSWSFTHEVESLEKLLKQKRREEIESGKATLRAETHFVMVRLTARRPLTPVSVASAPAEKRLHPMPSYIERARQAHPRAYEAWTPEEDVALAWQFRQGRTIAEMADAFQRQPGGIRSRLSKLGLSG